MAKITIADVRLDNYSKEALAAMREQVLLGLEAIGSEAEGYAKEECPVDTGLLRNSITYALSGKGAAIQGYTSDDGSKVGAYSGSAPVDLFPAVYIGTNVEYAVYVELNDKARHNTGNAHFLKNAAVNHMMRYRDLMELFLRGQG